MVCAAIVGAVEVLNVLEHTQEALTVRAQDLSGKKYGFDDCWSILFKFRSSVIHAASVVLLL